MKYLEYAGSMSLQFQEIIPSVHGGERESELKLRSEYVHRIYAPNYVPGFDDYSIYSPLMESTPVLVRQSHGVDAPNMSYRHIDFSNGETAEGNKLNGDRFLAFQGFNGKRVQIIGKFASEMYDFSKAKINPEGVRLDTHTDYQIIEVSSLDFGNKDHDDPANIVLDESDPAYTDDDSMEVEANFVFTRDPNLILTIKPADCPIVVGYAKDRSGNDLMFVDHSGRDAANAGLTYQGLLYLRDVLGVDLYEMKVVVLPGVSRENYFITNQPERRGWGISEENWGENIDPKYPEWIVEGLLRVHPKYNEELPEERKDLLREQIRNGQLRNVDIPEATIIQLLKAGVPPENIEAILVDSYEEAKKGNAYSQRYTNESGGKRKGRSIVAAQLKRSEVESRIPDSIDSKTAQAA